VTTRESIGVGMLGYAFMGKAHSRAFRGDAIVRSAESGRREEITYRGVDG
jgi:hypothetical protein